MKHFWRCWGSYFSYLFLCPLSSFLLFFFSFHFLDQIRGPVHPHRPRPPDSLTWKEGFWDLSVPGGGAWLHANAPESDFRGHWHRAPGGPASPQWRGPSQRPSPGTPTASRNSQSEAVVQRLPVFGQSPDSEQCGRVLRAGLEKGEEAQEAESSPGATSTNTPAAATAAEDCGEPSHTHACSRAGSQVETPARKAEGTQPQDPWTGEGPTQCLTNKAWHLTLESETTSSSHSVTLINSTTFLLHTEIQTSSTKTG